MIIASIYPCPFDVQDRHEFNASLINKDKIYAYEEGKLTNIKNDGTSKFPERSLMMGFKELNITPDKVDKWVFPTPTTKIKQKDYFLFFTWFFKAYVGKKNDFPKWFEKHVEFVDHQLSHAALAVYGSNFNETAFLCMDGGGDFGDPRGYIFGDYKNKKFNVKFQSKGVDNIANFHSFLTDSIGFSGDDNGKTSGLASYGKIQQPLKKEFLKLIRIKKNIGVKFKRERFNKTNVNLSKIKADSYDRTKIFNFYPSDTNIFRLGAEYLPHDIAATGEEVLRESVQNLIKILRKETSLKNIVFSGGLFQNVGLNQNLLESEFEEVYFPSAPSDSGLSLGAALFIKNKKIANSKKTLSAYLGPSFSNKEIKQVLDSHRMIYSKPKNLIKKTAQLISAGKTIGWFQGRGEYGPRSLGSRSLVADPRKIRSKEKINQLLKKRDWFMPYAPSILEEDYKDWIEREHYSPYMQVAFYMQKDKISKVPSAVHVDGTSRVHVVRKSENILYWNLIKEFKRITKIPVLLNTSFNRHGISTISTPRQAIEHLLEGCMDFLVIDEYLVSFEENRKIINKKQIIETEDYLLKMNAIKRLDVFKKFGSKKQLSSYINKLSSLIGEEIIFENKKSIILKNKKFDLDSIQIRLKKLLKS